jgi:RNA 2',3'-cyclic 3'-phosphodiesterase
MRLFIGIPMAEAVVHELASVRAQLERSGDGLRWSAPQSWHVTLQFLGNTSADRLQCLGGELRAIVSPLVPVKLEGLGFFDRAGVFFASVLLSPELIALQREVVSATSRCGFVAETRAYQPHITLARKRGQGSGIRRLKAAVLPEPRFPAFAAREFLLYESFLGSAGSRYEVRERFLFAA